MRGPPRHLAREKAAKWRLYKECRREFGRNHELSAAALAEFISVNYHYRDFVRISQHRYEISIVDKLSSVPAVPLIY